MTSILTNPFLYELGSYFLGALSVFGSIVAIKRKLGIEVLSPEGQEILKKIKSDLVSLGIRFENTREEIRQAQNINFDLQLQLYKLSKEVDIEKVLQVIELARSYQGKGISVKEAADLGKKVKELLGK